VAIGEVVGLSHVPLFHARAEYFTTHGASHGNIGSLALLPFPDRRNGRIRHYFRPSLIHSSPRLSAASLILGHLAWSRQFTQGAGYALQESGGEYFTPLLVGTGPASFPASGSGSKCTSRVATPSCILFMRVKVNYSHPLLNSCSPIRFFHWVEGTGLNADPGIFPPLHRTFIAVLTHK